MKRVGKLCLCLAGGLVLGTGLRAAEAVPPDNPYAPIATRNVFAITPPPPPAPVLPPTEPPPKITLNGIMSVYGRMQVLFRAVIPPKPGQPGREQSYILGEGQQQDDIEVEKINETAGAVTFNNHGTIQDLLLSDKTASGPSASDGSGPGPGPGYPAPRFAPGRGGDVGGGSSIVQFGGRFGQSGGAGGQNPGGVNAGNNFNNAGASPASHMGVVMAGGGGGFSSQQPGAQSGAQPPAMSAEDQAVLVTAQHLNAIQHNDPAALIFPPSQFDGEAGVPSNVETPVPPPGAPGAPGAH